MDARFGCNFFHPETTYTASNYSHDTLGESFEEHDVRNCVC
ncbi:hypothetical protein SAMN02745220_05022 [Desulfopila aestuarii DSM 18488]|uniref:Uncharacterized protein n=1 Tax=Desulfopila aestuarii DSM 18488 TaxID=1121416 RepID=A0A1M7YKY1_9BACT|nr:hypothetical protein SAMN02745220_05022 [Desulfopila aestuarii DSM 18488]